MSDVEGVAGGYAVLIDTGERLPTPGAAIDRARELARAGCTEEGAGFAVVVRVSDNRFRLVRGYRDTRGWPVSITVAESPDW
jgi:hypothetical protein